MNENLQYWANLSQVISLPIAVLSLILMLLQYFYPQPPLFFKPLWQRLRLFLPYIFVAALSFLLGARFFSTPETVTPLQATQTAEAKLVGVNPEKPPTGIPTPTKTPRPTPTPTATIDADPTVYDNFNNPANDGRFDKGRWYLDNSEDACEVYQREGALVFSVSNTTSQDKGCALSGPKTVLGNRLELFEAKMKIAEDVKSEMNITLVMGTDASGFTEGGWMECGLVVVQNEINASFGITTHGGGVGEFRRNYPVEYNRWYNIRYEVDRATMRVSCFVDNNLIGEVMPQDASRLYKTNVDRTILIYLTPGASATAFIDDIRVIP
ncbi:MAG: hypothetical protein U0401_30860 [Anaerolineae bacterium]